MATKLQTVQSGDLRVWHIPQIPGKPFYVEVASPDEAIRIMQLLADYDYFQLKHNIKPDYSNAQGLQVYDNDGEWVDWYDDEGDDIDAYAEKNNL